jgi:hypothetical protein
MLTSTYHGLSFVKKEEGAEYKLDYYLRYLICYRLNPSIEMVISHLLVVSSGLIHRPLEVSGG